jgi:5-enolpyruvylshikimate-3-phosphate synthase
MAGLLMTAGGTPLLIENPMVVAKSYPTFWHDARRVGWVVGAL